MRESSIPNPSTALGGRPVLVTGAAGFIGRRLARRLAELGADVYGTTRRQSFDGLDPEIRWKTVDLSHPDEADRLVAETAPEVVFHLAGHVAGSRDLDLVGPTLRGNLCAAVYLMEAAARHGCERFVHTGSLEEPDDPHASPSSPYAASKAAASAYARMFSSLYDLSVVVARVFMVYGPGRQDEKKLVPYVIRSLLAGESPSFSSGVRPVDWIFVDDVVEGFLRLGMVPDLGGRRLDLGTGKLHTVREMVEGIFRTLEAPSPPEFGGLGDRAAEQVRRADVATTAEAIGWRPRTSLDHGIERTVEWFREHPSD